MVSKQVKIILLIQYALLVGCNMTLASPTNAPASLQTVIVATPVVGVPSTVQITTPTQSSVYASSGLMVTVDLASFSNAPVLLIVNQKLVVVPPMGWGSQGWDVTYDAQLLQLDSQIDAQHPPSTGWAWTPKSKGQTTIIIGSIPDPCLKVTPPCSKPIFGAILNVQISQ